MGLRLVVGAVLIAVFAASVWLVTHVGSRPSPVVPAAGPSAPAPQADVPWVARPRTMQRPVLPTVPPPPADARPCRSSDLRVDRAGSNGATGTTLTGFEFVNTSSTTCALTGYPSVVATLARHQPVAARQETFFASQNAGGNIAPGEGAYSTLFTARDCDARYSVPGKFPELVYDHAIFRLLGGDKEVAVRLDVLCGLGTSTFSVRQALPPPLPEQTLAVQVQLSSTAHPGETLRYVVALTNPSDAPISLDPCPDYIESAGDFPDAVKSGYQLNCDGVHEIGAHGTVRYAMELDIPMTAPPGRARIYWSITNFITASASADVEVR